VRGGAAVRDGGTESSGGQLVGLWWATMLLTTTCVFWGFKDFLIEWNYLKDREVSPDKNVYAKHEQRKTFAQALGTTCDIPLS